MNPEPLNIAPYFRVGELVTVNPDEVINPEPGTFRITREPVTGRKKALYLAESVTDPSVRISVMPYMLLRAQG